jgi:glucosamine kinase
MKQRFPCVIGIDGGGTLCRASLRLESGQRFNVVGGSANLFSGFDVAISNIRQLFVELSLLSRLDLETLLACPVHLGLAGMMNEAYGQRVIDELGLRLAKVTVDVPTMIVGALGEADGAVAAIGTGSFIGHQLGGKVTYVGGWGFLLGDQASGAWLGRKALEQTLLAHDGVVAHSKMTRTLHERFGKDGNRIISVGNQPSDYAAFAKDVVEFSKQNDAVAISLMQEGAAYVQSCLHAIGWKQGELLCLTGGLGPSYQPWINIPTIEAKGSALDGALALAERIAQ